jgi:hypothetical protein
MNYDESHFEKMLEFSTEQFVETRFVCTGHFDESLSEEDDLAKECLFVVRKR